MKKLILSAALTAVSATSPLLAQNSGYAAGVMRAMKETKAQLTFNAPESFINIRDFVTLKQGKLILELAKLDDYDDFRNMDSILTELRHDIAFYKDSLAANPTGNVRIDYCYSPGFSFKKIRFKEYAPDGNMFVNRDGDVSRLKFAQDTVRIVIQKSTMGIGGRCSIPYSIQATLLLDNYYDVDKLVAEHSLRRIIDTLAATANGKKQQGTRIFANPVSVVYNPYFNGPGSLKKYNMLLANEYDYMGRPSHPRYLSLKASVTAGLIRNSIVPGGELGIQYNHITGNDRDFFRLSAAPYAFFDHTAGTENSPQGNFVLNDNWFVTADVGTTYEQKAYGWFGQTGSFGVGYLVSQKGGYFKNNTFKIFTDIQFVKGLTICPEIIFTDNAKQIFPGFTVKVF